MNVNDWKIIQVRNDVKYIKRQLTGNRAAEWSLVIDLFLVLLAFALDRAFGVRESPNLVLMSIAFMGFIVPLALFILERIKTRRHEKISRKIVNTRELVSMFDDEVCYLIMTAETFNSSLKKLEPVSSRQSALMLQFYVIETAYYLNKAVQLIVRLDNNLISVLNETDIIKPHISKTRLINAINLLASIYFELITFCQTQKNALALYSIQLDESEVKKHYKILRSFTIEREKTIGIKIDDTFSANFVDLDR